MITASTGTVSLSVQEVSQVGEARRLAAALGRGLGFNPTQLSTASLLATEAANNLIKHAGGGELIFHCLEDGNDTGLEIFSLDKGPGMVDVERCMEDGYSTAGSPGTGLGAMERLSSFLDIYSRPEHGTIILMQLRANSRRAEIDSPFTVGGVSVPYPGEPVCGDSWISVRSSERIALMVSDGLGHGPLAAEASEEAARSFRDNPHRPPAEVLADAHGALRATRGAAIAVAEINLEEKTVRFAGIGNISATILSDDSSRSMISHNGIVGHQVHKIQEISYPWPADGLLLMHSDGIQTRWGLDDLPGLAKHHPSLVSAAIYRDFRRPKDDVTVVCARPTDESF